MLNNILAKIKSNKRDLLILLACFGVPFVAMMVIYACLTVWPLGKFSVLVLDLNAQYIYYFEQLRDVLTSGESLLYSFERALGGEFMGIFAYYLSSPFSFIIAMFPKESITEAMHLILVLKTGCCGLAFGYYLTKTRPALSGAYRVMFSVMYALSSYVVVMQNNVMWIDNVIAFPIILYALDELIQHGRFKLYMVFLVYAIFSNFYIGYMMCIFVAVWFFARYFMLTPAERNPHGERLHFVKSLLRIILYSFVAVLICAVILLPVYHSLTFGKLEFSTPNYTAKQMFEFADLITKAFFGSYDTVRPAGMPFIYCGTLALILAPLYFFSDTISTRKKIAFGAIMLFLIVGFNFSIADLVWHGLQRPNWLNSRFAFMFSGLMLIMSVDVFMDMKKIGIKAAKISAVAWCVLLLIFDKFGYTHLENSTVIWPAILIFFVISAILPSAVRLSKSTFGGRLAALSLCAFILIEGVGNGVIMLYKLHKDVVYSTRSSYRTMVDKYTDAIDTFKDESSDEFYRAEKLVHRKKNDNFALDINGLSNSTSTLNAKAIALLKQFGYSSMSHWSLYSGNTPVTDALFGIKYIMTDETKKPDTYFEDLYSLHATTSSQINVYENPYTLSIAYAVNPALLDFYKELTEEEKSALPEEQQKAEYQDPFKYMNSLVSAMLGEETSVWNKVTVSSSNFSGCRQFFVEGHKGYEKNADGIAKLSYQLKITSDETIFAYFPSDYPRSAEVWVNGVKLCNYFKNETFAIFELGKFEVGETVNVELRLSEQKMYVKTGCTFFWYLDTEAFAAAMDTLSEGTLDAHSDKDTHIYGTINVPADKQLIFTTIPYDSGWQVYVDGKAVETVSVLSGTLLAFEADAGEHEIELVYRPKMFTYGVIFSLLGVLLFTAFCLLDRKKNRLRLSLTGVPATTEDDALANEDIALITDEELWNKISDEIGESLPENNERNDVTND